MGDKRGKGRFLKFRCLDFIKGKIYCPSAVAITASQHLAGGGICSK